MSCSSILQRHAGNWHPALHHPFLTACGRGDIAPAAFNQWLAQDHQFVLRFRELAAHVTSAAPSEDAELLHCGVEALDDELRWFKEKISERALDAGAPLHQVTAEYCAYMQRLRGRPYAVLATAFWAIEYAYNQGWAALGEVAKPYAEFANRWGSAGFSSYVHSLQQQADAALAAGGEEVQREAEEAAGVAIPQLEVQFWQMALTP